MTYQFIYNFMGLNMSAPEGEEPMDIPSEVSVLVCMCLLVVFLYVPLLSVLLSCVVPIVRLIII